jgi:hypothetical protein
LPWAIIFSPLRGSLRNFIILKAIASFLHLPLTSSLYLIVKPGLPVPPHL